jgi:hypothetical protein
MPDNYTGVSAGTQTDEHEPGVDIPATTPHPSAPPSDEDQDPNRHAGVWPEDSSEKSEKSKPDDRP